MKKQVEIYDHERIDSLQRDGLSIIQNPDGFCFGIDAVLLANYVSLKKKAKVVEFGTGTGIISILLANRFKNADITAFEIQKDVGEMAKRSIVMNELDDRIHLVIDDMKAAIQHLGKGSVDTVVMNPPYFKGGSGIKNENDYKTISRHEVTITLEEILKISHTILRPMGTLYMIHRPNRLVELIHKAKLIGLEPKEIQFIQPTSEKAANLLLIKYVRNGGEELKIKDPLVVYDDERNFTKEIYDIYHHAGITSFEKE